MPGSKRILTLDEYAHERGDELHSMGGSVDQLVFVDLGDELTVSGYISFGREHQMQLRFFEAIAIRDGEPHRRKYTYQLTYRGLFEARYDRDPVAHPRNPEHKHIGVNRRRVRWGRVTLHDIVDEAYKIVQKEEAQEDAAGGTTASN